MKPRTATCAADRDERCDRGEVEERPNVDGVHAGADERSGDRADAERGVEARHDRPVELLLDCTSLDVHGDVPLAGAEPETNSPAPTITAPTSVPTATIARPVIDTTDMIETVRGGTQSVHDNAGGGQ